MKVWKDYITEDAIVVLEKATKTIMPKTMNSCWRKLYPDVVHDFTGWTTEPNQGSHERDFVPIIKKVGQKRWQKRWGLQGMGLWEIWELLDPTPEELAEEDLKEMSALELVPDNEEEDLEEAVPENKWTLDSRAEGFRLLKTAFDFLYDVDSSMIQALKWKQMLVPHSSIFREIKKQKSQTNIFLRIAVKLHLVYLSLLPPSHLFNLFHLC